MSLRLSLYNFLSCQTLSKSFEIFRNTPHTSRDGLESHIFTYLMSDSYKLLDTRISLDKTRQMLRKKIAFFEVF